MKRSALNFVIDFIAFLNLLALALTGLIMKYILPPGSGGLGRAAHDGRGRESVKTLLSLSRHQWGSIHFYLALYWAQALAEQNDDAGLKSVFFPLVETLMLNEGKILNKFIEAQGKPVELNGYYCTDPDALAKAMRPSDTFNRILDSVG